VRGVCPLCRIPSREIDAPGGTVEREREPDPSANTPQPIPRRFIPKKIRVKRKDDSSLGIIVWKR